MVPLLSQVKRSEEVFRMSGHKPKITDCAIIGVIIKEANEPPVRLVTRAGSMPQCWPRRRGGVLRGNPV